MNLVQKVIPLLSIIGFDTGEETAVETRPLPMWQPEPGREIERVIERVVNRDGNVTVFERETIYASAPAPTPEPKPEYAFVTVRQSHPLTPEQWQILHDWRAGKIEWLGGTRHPADILRNGSESNARIVLGGRR